MFNGSICFIFADTAFLHGVAVLQSDAPIQYLYRTLSLVVRISVCTCKQVSLHLGQKWCHIDVSCAEFWQACYRLWLKYSFNMLYSIYPVPYTTQQMQLYKVKSSTQEVGNFVFVYECILCPALLPGLAGYPPMSVFSLVLPFLSFSGHIIYFDLFPCIYSGNTWLVCCLDNVLAWFSMFSWTTVYFCTWALE